MIYQDPLTRPSVLAHLGPTSPPHGGGEVGVVDRLLDQRVPIDHIQF